MDSKNKIQLIWGFALVLMGVAFLFRFPYVLERLFVSGHSGIFHVFLSVCMFLVSIILIGGGVKKLIHIRRVLIKSSSSNNLGKTDG